MKQTVQTASLILLFFILLLAYIKLFGPIPFSINSVTTTKSDTFTVSGVGKTIATPDIALVTVGVSSAGSTVKAAQDQINTVINKVTDGIKQLEVEDKDIKTSNYNIYPNYDHNGNQRITGFSASTNLIIKVRNIDKVNEVIDSATSNGANQVGGITFDIDDKTKAQNEARSKAVEEAKSKAEQVAQIAGFKLGKVINYQESFGGDIRTVPMMALGGGEKTATTDIQPGSSEIQVTVTLSYELL